MKCWYRFDDHFTAPPLDEWDNPCGPSGHRVMLREYPVIKDTPCGAWLRVDGQDRWTKRDVIKHFACPAIEEAAESFIARKRRQRSIYLERAARAEQAIRIVTRELYGHLKAQAQKLELI